MRFNGSRVQIPPSRFMLRQRREISARAFALASAEARDARGGGSIDGRLALVSLVRRFAEFAYRSGWTTGRLTFPLWEVATLGKPNESVITISPAAAKV